MKIEQQTVAGLFKSIASANEWRFKQEETVARTSHYTSEVSVS
jgi:hypothetical protein